jgi:A118 family predicted phage portal protein
MVSIQEYLKKQGFNVAEDETTKLIDVWQSWYKGYVKDFHHYTVYNGVDVVKKDRYRLNMAKTICEDWANLLLNEKVKIYTGTDFDKELEKVFEYNNFRVKGNQLIELAFALGTGAFVQYLDASGEVVIDFIRAGMIFPLSWDNGYVNECAFGSMRERDGKKQYYIQIHKLNEQNTYVIENHIVDAETGDEIELDEGLLPEVDTGSEIPLFQIITPNIVNNIDLDSPYGISVYANAIPQLKGCDIVYDSYINEFDLGKKRIMVPLSMAKIQMGENGVTKPVFDKNDTVFYALPGDRNGDGKIDTFDPQIRADEHDKGINKALDLLSFKCGMGTGRYRFENGTVKTATEVISDKSELYQSLKKHEIVLDSALTDMVKAIGQLKGETIEKVSIDFDDSIIQDKETERQQDRQDVAMGVMPPWEYRAKWYGETEKEAKAKIPEQADIIT